MDDRYLLKLLTTLPDDLIEETWILYHTCMAPLEVQSAQVQVMTKDDFTAMMLDERFVKGLVIDDGGVSAMGVYTTDLTSMPGLVSWKFYRHHWQDEYDRAAIFYVVFIASAGQHRAYRMFVEHVFSLANPARGLVAMDVCNFNEEEHFFIEAIARTTRVLSHRASRHYRISYQGFWMFDVTGQATYPFTGEIEQFAEAKA